MVIERFLFRPPNPPHYTLRSHRDHLFWLPPGYNAAAMPKVPCMIYSPSHQAKIFMIWCHGNGYDIGTMHSSWKLLSEQLGAHILVFEYPSYGLCEGSIKPNRDTINNHAERAYSFVRHTLKWPPHRIVIYGHSVGSGAACHIASRKPVGALILQSPYTSIKDLIKEKIHLFSSWIADSYWDNLRAVRYVRCPTLLIHGQRDTLIPPEHSQLLYSTMKRIKHKKLVLLQNDDHNSISDPTLLKHLQPFLHPIFSPSSKPLPPIHINSSFRMPPTNMASEPSPGLLTSLFD